eukprot:5706241-Pyramimonas_sp.AAC.1
MPPAWQFSIIRTLVGGWTTERRMCQKDAKCLFECPSEMDDQQHYLSCPTLWGLVQSHWKANLPIEHHLGKRLGLARRMTPEQRALALHRLVIAFYAYNHRRQGWPVADSVRAARAQLLQQ